MIANQSDATFRRSVQMLQPAQDALHPVVLQLVDAYVETRVWLFAPGSALALTRGCEPTVGVVHRTRGDPPPLFVVEFAAGVEERLPGGDGICVELFGSKGRSQKLRIDTSVVQWILWADSPVLFPSLTVLLNRHHLLLEEFQVRHVLSRSWDGLDCVFKLPLEGVVVMAFVLGSGVMGLREVVVHHSGRFGVGVPGSD